jgi:hypothetical protein
MAHIRRENHFPFFYGSYLEGKRFSLRIWGVGERENDFPFGYAVNLAIWTAFPDGISSPERGRVFRDDASSSGITLEFTRMSCLRGTCAAFTATARIAGSGASDRNRPRPLFLQELVVNP